MQEHSYWSNLASQRASRRGVLAGGAALAGAAALLAACGGSSKSTTGDTTSGGLVFNPTNTLAQAKPGGVLLHFQQGDPQHFDVTISNTALVTGFVSMCYPRLLKLKMGEYPNEADGSVEGEAVESYEISGDKMTITMKLRQGMKWDSRAPTNSRVIDAQDVLVSWKKFVALNPAALDIAPAIDSVTAPDNNTLVWKLKQPDADVIPLFASNAHFKFEPREADGGFDPRKDVRGYGPWTMESYTPSVGLVYKKNPDYHVKGRPFPDELRMPIIPEYITRLAQFRAGNIYTSVVQPNDLVGTKKDIPATLLLQAPDYPQGNILTFGYEGDSPFKDARARQAVGMLIDPEGFALAIENQKELESNGIPVKLKRNTVVKATYGPWWLDVADTKSFGPTSKNLNYNPTEAKQLMSAAGWPNGVEFNYTFVNDGRYATPYPEIVEVFTSMLETGGMKVKRNGIPYQDYISQYYLSYSNGGPGFNGLIHRTGRNFVTAAAHLYGYCHKGGSIFEGSTVDGKNANQGDPNVNSRIEQIKGEYDTQKQIALTHDFIKYYTGQLYSVPRPTDQPTLSLVWPVVGMSGYHTGDNAWTGAYMDWWIDTSKAPLKTS